MITHAEEYRAAAKNVVAQLREDLGVELKYDEQSVEWLDGYINRIRTQLDKETYPGLATALGAYVGEAIINTYGGAWAYFEQQDQWGIRFDNGDGAFPISKVYKQLEDGELDSILSFFTLIPKIRGHFSQTENLFSYGTLRIEEVQLSTFGRRLEGRPAVLEGYRLVMIRIEDQDFVKKSGSADHRNIEFTGNPSDFVEGFVFSVTKKELEQSDDYEPTGYKRIIVRLRSGLDAWVYLNDY